MIYELAVLFFPQLFLWVMPLLPSLSLLSFFLGFIIRPSSLCLVLQRHVFVVSPFWLIVHMLFD